MTTLSVIIPVYKVEATLESCLTSVLAQDVNDGGYNMDIILIDDGSPDSCGEKCDQYAAKHKNIRVVHQANGGLSAARNSGIDIAKGDYITFVDSDDVIAPDTYKPIIKQLSLHPEYDILEYSVSTRHSDGSETPLRLENYVYTSFQDYWLKAKAYQHAYSWNKIFSKRVFADGTRFRVGQVFEDIHLMWQLCTRQLVIATTSIGKYIYNENKNGITANATGEQLSGLLETNIAIADTIPTLNEYIFAQILNIQIDVYRITGKLFIHKIPHLQHGNVTWRERIKLNVAKIIGISNLCRILKISHP